MPDSLRIFKTHPERNASLLKMSLLSVASLTCEPARALCGLGDSVLWGLKSKCGAILHFLKTISSLLAPDTTNTREILWKLLFHRHNLAEVPARAVLPCYHVCQPVPQLRICGMESHRRRTQEKGKPKDASDLTRGGSCGGGGPGSAGRGAGIISALRTPPWLPSAWEHPGRHLSRGRRCLRRLDGFTPLKDHLMF